MEAIEVYIASSWRHAATVTNLTQKLRDMGLTVHSWLENSGNEDPTLKDFDLESWLLTQDSERCFQFDLDGLRRVNLMIYVGPSGIDAWAEVGFVAGRGDCLIWALWGANEEVGIMRKLLDSRFSTKTELLEAVLARFGIEKRLEQPKTVDSSRSNL